jgi:hypothetical protein
VVRRGPIAVAGGSGDRLGKMIEESMLRRT